MRDDFTRLTSPKPAAPQPRSATASQSPRPSTEKPAPVAVPAPPAATPATRLPPATAPTPVAIESLPLAGRSELEIRAALGSPSAEEERPPGKRWRYRDGQCTLDIQLYPNVETKQFTTLAYDVRNNVDSDEGKRLCMAQFHARLEHAR